MSKRPFTEGEEEEELLLLLMLGEDATIAGAQAANIGARMNRTGDAVSYETRSRSA